jgi:hypothetical protein
MTLQELIDEARRMSDDKAGRKLYDDDFMTLAGNEGEREACLCARLLFDDTSGFLELPLVEDDVSLPLDARIDHIDYATFTPTGGAAQKLDVVGIDAIRACDPTGRMLGQPRKVARIGQRLRVWPKANAAAAGMIKLEVYRLPISDMTLADEPEIAPRYHLGLVHWMLHKAFLTKDGEAGDDAYSTLHFNKFHAIFGPSRDADAHTRHAEGRRITTRYGGIR